jgi:hypothetical protein
MKVVLQIIANFNGKTHFLASGLLMLHFEYVLESKAVA